MTPASSRWEQKKKRENDLPQSRRRDSVPVHATSEIRILPSPEPKKAPRTLTAPVH